MPALLAVDHCSFGLARRALLALCAQDFRPPRTGRCPQANTYGKSRLLEFRSSRRVVVAGPLPPSGLCSGLFSHRSPEKSTSSGLLLSSGPLRFGPLLLVTTAALRQVTRWDGLLRLGSGSGTEPFFAAGPFLPFPSSQFIHRPLWESRVCRSDPQTLT